MKRIRLELILLAAVCAFGCAHRPSAVAVAKDSPGLDRRFRIGALLYSDDFSGPLNQWNIELEHGGSVAAHQGALDVDVPAGATVWFKPLLTGPVLIQYRATAISAGGPNDHVSDLNCFWMARDSRDPANLFAVHRSGKFADYNALWTYYVGVGGNRNTTTRFRRYIGDNVVRPLLPQNDRRDPADLLAANRTQLIQLVADGPLIQFYRDGVRLFELKDPNPYTSGWFGFRTTQSHIRFSDFRVYRLINTGR